MKVVYYHSKRGKHQQSTVHAVKDGDHRFQTDTHCGLTFVNAYPSEMVNANRVTCGRCKRVMASWDKA